MRTSRIILRRNYILYGHLTVEPLRGMSGYSVGSEISNSNIFSRQYFTLERLKKIIE